MQPYIIGETAYNHEGDFEYLKRMIAEISDIGLQAVKFHLLMEPKDYLQNNHPLLKTIRNWMFSEEQWHELIQLSSKKGLDVIALCDDAASIQFIQKYHHDIKAIELHATSINDLFMLEESYSFANQIILGIGGLTLDEIQYAVDYLKNKGKEDILLMYGFQAYPTNYAHIHLAKMLKLKDLFQLPVGYADHTVFNDENNVDISAMAAAMGINVLEKHYTPDYGKKRIDYHGAVGREQMIVIKNKMALYLQVLGDDSLGMSQSEQKYGNMGPMKKAIVAKSVIRKGEKLSLSNLCFKRTVEETMIKQRDLLGLVGLEAIVDINEDEIIDYTKVKYEFIETSYQALTGGLEEKK